MGGYLKDKHAARKGARYSFLINGKIRVAAWEGLMGYHGFRIRNVRTGEIEEIAEEPLMADNERDLLTGLLERETEKILKVTVEMAEKVQKSSDRIKELKEQLYLMTSNTGG